jgi:hypothetical protein
MVLLHLRMRAVKSQLLCSRTCISRQEQQVASNLNGDSSSSNLAVQVPLLLQNPNQSSSRAEMGGVHLTRSVEHRVVMAGVLATLNH